MHLGVKSVTQSQYYYYLSVSMRIRSIDRLEMSIVELNIYLLLLLFLLAHKLLFIHSSDNKAPPKYFIAFSIFDLKCFNLRLVPSCVSQYVVGNTPYPMIPCYLEL
jgi:hypothetical protein